MRSKQINCYYKTNPELFVVMSNWKKKTVTIGRFRLLPLYKKRCVKECKEPFNYLNILLWSRWKQAFSDPFIQDR